MLKPSGVPRGAFALDAARRRSAASAPAGLWSPRDPHADGVDVADARDTLIVRAPDARALSRRDAIRAGGGLAALALLAGCAGAKRTASLPSPLWPSDVPMSPSQNMRSWPAEPTPTPAAREPEAAPLGPLRVNPRSSWATAGIVPARMDRQSPLRRITIHHDGMPPVSIAGRADAAARIDLIRRLHQDNQGWGEIGRAHV